MNFEKNIINLTQAKGFIKFVDFRTCEDLIDLNRFVNLTDFTKFDKLDISAACNGID